MKKIILLPALYVLIILIIVSVGCGEKNPTGDLAKAKTIKAKTSLARITSQPFLYEAVGTIHAKLESTLSSKLMATVKSIRVSEGDKVKKGDVLVILDPIQVDAGLSQSQATLEEAKRANQAAVSAANAAATDAELARTTYVRYQQLLKQNSISLQEFDEVKARYQGAQAALTRAKEMLKASAQQIERAKGGLDSAIATKTDTEIRAPYDGIITAKRVEEGDLATPGAPLLTAEGGGGYRVDMILPESYLPAVSIGQKLAVTISGTQAVETEGTVQTIFPASDPTSRTFLVKAALSGDIKVHSGMFARISIPVGEDRLMLIPKSAIILQGQLTGIFKVNTDRTAMFRLVRTGREFREQTEIISGLKDGDPFVVIPAPELANGMRVEELP